MLKHPLNQSVVEALNQFLPPSVTAWFLPILYCTNLSIHFCNTSLSRRKSHAF